MPTMLWLTWRLMNRSRLRMGDAFSLILLQETSERTSLVCRSSPATVLKRLLAWEPLLPKEIRYEFLYLDFLIAYHLNIWQIFTISWKDVWSRSVFDNVQICDGNPAEGAATALPLHIYCPHSLPSQNNPPDPPPSSSMTSSITPSFPFTLHEASFTHWQYYQWSHTIVQS